MNRGDIILINFPFTIPALSKVRPAVVITITDDRFHDIVVCAISSVVPEHPSRHDMILRTTEPDFAQTGLRADSVVKMDRIATLRRADVITTIGKCSPKLWQMIADSFRNLVA